MTVPPGYGSPKDADRTRREIHRYRGLHGRLPDPGTLARLARCSLDLASDILAFTRIDDL
jgi:hypothetical protein